MRRILAFLILSSGTASSQYVEKTRFDRSIHDDSGVLITDEYLPLKRWTFYDYDTNFKVYKDKEENTCYLEKMDDSVAIEDLPGYGTQKKISKILYASTNALTKLEAWRMAGGRVIEFCHGRELILLQDTVPVIEEMADPFFNVIPQDENDIVTRRVADVVLTPLISRAKRQVMLEEREELNENHSRERVRRQAQYPRGRFRGQTQSQYLNTGNDEQKEGKAEAEATQQTSRAVVSGSRGMGQAQSMSFGSSGCEDCLKYSSEGAPDRYVHLPGPRPGVITPGSDTDTTYTRGPTYPSGIPGTADRGGVSYPAGTPGTTTGGGVTYPGGIPGTITGGGGVSYPGGIPGTTTGGGTVYPGGIPGTTTTGGGVTYPGGIPGTTTTGGAVTYPGGMPGTTTGGGVTYPGGVPGTTTTGGGVTYPGGIPGTTTTGGGVVYPGGGPGTTTTGSGVAYPGGTTTTGDRIGYPGQIVTESKATTDTRIYPGQISGIPSYGVGVSSPDQGSGTVHFPGGYPGRIIETPGIIPTNVGTYPGSLQTGTPGSIPQQLNYPGGVAPAGTNVIQPGVQIGPGGSVIHYPGTSGTVPSHYPVQQGQYPGGTSWQGYQGQTIPDVTGGVNRQGEYTNRGQGIGQQYPPGMRPGEVAQYYQQPGSSPSVEDDNSNSQASSSVKQTDSGTQASASSQGTYGQGTAQSQVTGTYSGSGSFSAQAGSSDNNKSAQTEISGGKEGATSNAQGSGGYGKSQAQVQLDSESGATSTGAQSSGWNHGTNSQVQASSRGGMADAQANGEGSTSSQAQIGFQPYLKTDEKVERHSRPFRGGGTASAQSGANRGQSQSQLEGSFQYGITYTGAAQAGSGSGAAASRKPFKFNMTDTELFKPFKPYNTPQIPKNNESSVTNTPPDIDYDHDNPSQGLQPSSSSRKTVFANATKETSRSVANKQNQSGERIQTDDPMYDYDEEYDEDDYYASQIHASNAKYSKNYITEQNNSDYQSQTIHIASGNQYDARVHQDSTMAQSGDMLQPGQSLSGYTIPPGFRGRVKSVAGEETIAHGDGKSQSQTVSLTPIATTHENKSPSLETRSLKTNHERLAEKHILTKEKHQKHAPSQLQNQQTPTDYSKSANVPIKPSYYTVTNSFAGKMDGKSSPKKYEHRYYTKSSTCGYFTFSCNIVYGSNGRTKICKPKIPTHPDGTPVKC